MLLGRVGRAALGTLASRLSGFVRDAAIAYAFGASASYDAFLVGLFIPQALRQVIGEAGLATAFVPVYAQARARGQDVALLRAFTRVLLLALVPIVGLGCVLARLYVPVLAAGFPPEKMREAISLAAWLFPLIAFVSLSALQAAVLNVHGAFFLPALAPALLNLGMALGALFLSALFRPPIFGLVAGTLLGGLFSVLFLWPSFRRHYRGPARANPVPAPEIRRDLGVVGWRLLPALGGLLVAEANTLVDNRLASYLPHGSIATLQYAMRLFQFPLGVLAVSVATVALPALADHVAHEDAERFRRTLERGFLLTAALMVPATLGLGLLAEPAVAVLFERGAFGRADTLRTAQNLQGYVVGLWAYALVYLFSRAFFALGRPTLPLLGGALALGVNIGLNLWWVRFWGTFGLALATGVAGWVDALFLGALLWRKAPGWLVPKDLVRSFLAAGLMAAAVWGLREGLAPYGSWAQVLVAVPAGLFLYLGLARGLGLWTRLRAEG